MPLEESVEANKEASMTRESAYFKISRGSSFTNVGEQSLGGVIKSIETTHMHIRVAFTPLLRDSKILSRLFALTLDEPLGR